MDEIQSLLPVKQKDGKWVYPVQVLKADEKVDDEQNVVLSQDVDVPETRVPKTLVEKYAIEQKKLQNVKIKTALLCDHVTANPEKLAALKELVNMLSKPSTKLVVAEFKIVCYSLLHVFNDLLPGYKLRNVTETDPKVKLKKQTKQLLSQEIGLLRNYKSYIDCLQNSINAMKSKRALKNVGEVQKKALLEVGSTAIKCLGDLMVKKYYFNYFKAIINIVVPLTCHSDSTVSNRCCEIVQDVFKADKLGEASLDVVKQIIKIIKEKKFAVPVALMRTFLHLKVQDSKLNDDEKKKKADMKKVRKQINMMSRKEKKYKKKMKELEHELRETEAQESKETKSKFQTETLKKIFWIYFHVLKDDAKMNLVEPVLEGLSKFAYLINLEFFDDLSAVLSSLMANGNLSNIEKLHCMQTLFTILAGQAQSLNIDPQNLYSHLYNILLSFQGSTTTDHYHAALKCIEMMIIRRKKNVTVNRVLAFIKRLSTAALQSPLHFALASLSMVHCLISSKKNSDVLLDTENNLGSGIFMPELQDPEYANASSTSLWELCLLQKHYCPLVSMYSQYILNGCDSRTKMPHDLTTLDPKQILEKMDELNTNHNLEFKKYQTPAKRRCVRNESDFDFPTEKLTVDWNEVSDFNV